jgi:hypothetical protein
MIQKRNAGGHHNHRRILDDNHHQPAAMQNGGAPHHVRALANSCFASSAQEDTRRCKNSLHPMT